MKHLGLLGNGGALDQDEISILDSWRTADGHALAEGAGGVSIGLPVEILDVVIEAQCFEEESCANCTGRLQEVECDWRHGIQLVSVLDFWVGGEEDGLLLSNSREHDANMLGSCWLDATPSYEIKAGL